MRSQESHGGWRMEEERLLFAQIEAGRKENQPLKAIFAQVAAATGRKPNSVRNYYYARVKEQDLQTQALHVGAFVPFGQDDPEKKPCSMIARTELIEETLKEALEGRQIQPVIRGHQ